MYSLLMAIIGLGVISVFQIVFFKLKLVSTLPTSICVLMLVLYFLAFINALYMIDLIWLLCTFILIPILIIKKPKEIKARIRKGILNPSSLVFIFVTAIVIVGMSSFSIIAYDDFKFWAATVKSLFFQNGYGAPYTNIDINYGDYPQGTLLLLWMGEHCIGGGVTENTLYISFVFITLCFLMPLTGSIEKYRYVPIVVVLVIAFNSAFTLFVASLEPDRMMAPIYGATLVSAFNASKSRNRYYCVQFTLICCCIPLIKSVGIVWSIFALIFFYVIMGKSQKYLRNKTLIGASISVLIIYLSWNGYCTVLEREAYLTQEMQLSMGMPIEESFSHIKDHLFIVKMFFEVLFVLPANCANKFNIPFPCNGLMLSPVLYIILFLVIFFVAYRANIIDRMQFKAMSSFCFITSVAYYAILLWSYLFMFYPEFTKDSIAHMQNMTSHYAEPALVGSFMLILRCLLVSGRSKYIFTLPYSIKISQRCFACVLLTMVVSFPSTFFMLFGENFGISLHEVTAEDRRLGENQIFPIVESISNVSDPLNSRVLIVDDSLGNTGYCYAHYFLSPISTIDKTSIEDVESLKEIAKINHCNYIYVGSEYSDYIDDLKDEFGTGIELDSLFKINYT